MSKQNKFRIVVASNNNDDWLEYNLASILNQTYSNYEVIYIDDASTDNTLQRVTDIVDNDLRFSIVHHDSNMGGTYNHLIYSKLNIEDDTIIVLLDGDDWLFDIFVLEKLNDFYNKHDVWMTYGGMWVYRGEEHIAEATPQNTHHDDFIHEHKLYRKDNWRASHLRSYRAFLFKAVNDSDMRELLTGNYYWQAADLQLQFACMEMCGKDKIGVLDFPSYIYNATPKNSIRTAQRQMSSNHHSYEMEIRNRKHYKEGLSGEKLPQINIIGYNYEADYIPKTFTITYGLGHIFGETPSECDITLLTDFEVLKYINMYSVVFPENKNKLGKIVADLHETREYNALMNETYEAVYNNAHMFDLILTHDEKLLTLPNAKLRMIMWKTHLTQYRVNGEGIRKMQDESVCQLYLPKTKSISCISSNKSFLPGHKKRLEFVNSIITNFSKDVDIYGVGFNEIVGKIEALRDYKFSVAIENAYLPNWATEKFSDCLLTGTIPIYYGCPNVGDLFNKDGILSFQTIDELNSIINDIKENGEEIYKNRYDAVIDNFKIVQNYSLNLDQWFDKYMKDLL